MVEDTAVWYREPLFGSQLGDLISHDDVKDVPDEKVTVEKSMFDDLAIYKVQIEDVSYEDGGRYYCSTYGWHNSSQNVVVSVFERDVQVSPKNLHKADLRKSSAPTLPFSPSLAFASTVFFI